MKLHLALMDYLCTVPETHKRYLQETLTESELLLIKEENTYIDRSLMAVNKKAETEARELPAEDWNSVYNVDAVLLRCAYLNMKRMFFEYLLDNFYPDTGESTAQEPSDTIVQILPFVITTDERDTIFFRKEEHKVVIQHHYDDCMYYLQIDTFSKLPQVERCSESILDTLASTDNLGYVTPEASYQPKSIQIDPIESFFIYLANNKEDGALIVDALAQSSNSEVSALFVKVQQFINDHPRVPIRQSDLSEGEYNHLNRAMYALLSMSNSSRINPACFHYHYVEERVVRVYHTWSSPSNAVERVELTAHLFSKPSKKTRPTLSAVVP